MPITFCFFYMSWLTIIAKYDAGIMLLFETHLSPHIRFSLPTFTCHCQDPAQQLCLLSTGRTEVLVHRRISYRLLPSSATSVIECLVALEVDGSELCLISVYLRHGLLTDDPPRKGCLPRPLQSDIRPRRAGLPTPVADLSTDSSFTTRIPTLSAQKAPLPLHRTQARRS